VGRPQSLAPFTNLIATVTAAPYTFNWTNVAAAGYTLTARATDNQNGTITSAPVNVTVNTAVAQLYYIHTDHLNTPRAISNATGQEVWRWDHTEPFGADMANGNPSGLGTFEFNLRLPGQYFDKETNLHYNYFRDYDAGIGRYVQSDPIGLLGGLNTYAYVGGNPISNTDPLGLQQFPIPTSGTSGVQQAGAQAMACALNPAACDPKPACTCPTNVNPGKVIGGSTLAGMGVGAAVGGAVGIAHTPAAMAAAVGPIGAAGAAAGAFDMAVAGAMIVGTAATVAGVVVVGGIVIMNNASPNICPPEQCPKCP